MKLKVTASLLILVFAHLVFAKELETNALIMHNSPNWLKRTRVEKIVGSMSMHLEWTIRKIQVTWYNNVDDFLKVHSLGPMATAVTKRKDHSVHLGPLVTDENFDQVFAHEIVHVIFSQKHKDAIPGWLEEGLANYWAKKEKVDYKWMARQKFPADVRDMVHPFKKSRNDIIYHYRASQALIEMIASKCDLTNLLRLSVERKMEDYIGTYCEIKDLNQAFKQWVNKKAI